MIQILVLRAFLDFRSVMPHALQIALWDIIMILQTRSTIF